MGEFFTLRGWRTILWWRAFVEILSRLTHRRISCRWSWLFSADTLLQHRKQHLRIWL